MRIGKSSFWILLIALLIGCSANPIQPLIEETQSGPTATFPPAANTSPTPQRIASQTSSAEALLPVPTQSLPTASASPTLLANKPHIQNHCPEEKTGIRGLPDLPGTLVFSADNRLVRNQIFSPETGKDSMLSFWHSQSDTITMYDLEEAERYYYYAQSPENDKLALTEGKTLSISKDLMVVNHQGQELTRTVVPDEWTFFHWRNNDQLLLQQFRGGEKFNLVSINLTDNKQQALPIEFPEIYLNELFWSWGSQILFNPKANTVLYPIRKHNPEEIYTVLWNSKENNEIARIAASQWARWSPDGNRFLLVAEVNEKYFSGQNELFLINSSGEQSRATFLSVYFEQVLIDQPVWAPNNRYIAFWLSIYPKIMLSRT